MAILDSNGTTLKTATYNGKETLVGDDYKTQLANSVANWNQTTGQNLSAMDYDKKINPTTYGARWGIDDPNPAPASTAQAGGLLYSSANTPKAATYAPTTQTVSEKSTVQNQLANITANGSALNTAAETSAKKAMSSRGLLSSSIAVGAAQDAVLKNALPIAQQDAQTYANTDSSNAQFRNNADQFNAGQKNQLTGQLISSDTSLSVADKNIKAQAATTDKTLASQQAISDKTLASQQSISDKDNATKVQLQQIDADVKKSLAQMDETTKTKLQNLDATDKQLLQTNISAANAYAQLAQALANISTSTTMDASAKQQASDNQIGTFRATLQALGQVSGLDLSKYFQQVSTSAPAASSTSTSTQGATVNSTSGQTEWG